LEADRDEDVRERLTALFGGEGAYCDVPVDSPDGRRGLPPQKAGPGATWPISGTDGWRRTRTTSCRAASTAIVRASSRLFGAQPGEAGVHVMLCRKQNAFPVRTARGAVDVVDLAGEEALLLDPRRDDPDGHLVFTTGQAGPISLVKQRVVQEGAGVPALCQRGAMSILVYGLNRLGLVQERTRVLLRRLEFLSDLVTGLDEVVRRIAAADPDLATEVGPRMELLRPTASLWSIRVGDLLGASSGSN